MPPTINVEETHGPALKEKDVPRQSKFLITFNTNFKPVTTAQSKGMAASLRHGLKTLFTEEYMRDGLIHINDPNGSWEDIDDINLEYNIELGRGAQGKRIHSHAIVDIRHHTNIKLDLAFLRSRFPALIPDPRIETIYVNVRMLPSDFNAKRYLRKDGYDPLELIPAGAGDADGDLSKALDDLRL